MTLIIIMYRTYACACIVYLALYIFTFIHYTFACLSILDLQRCTRILSAFVVNPVLNYTICVVLTVQLCGFGSGLKKTKQ